MKSGFLLYLRFTVMLFVAPAWMLVAGCDSGSGTVSVRGQITYAGQPVSRGRVTFEPIKLEDPSAPLRPAMASIQPDGTFVLSTFASGDGVLPGEYKVIVWSVENEPGDDDWGNIGTTFHLGWLVPEKYGYSKSTPLTATIPDGKAVKLTFELTDD